MELDEIREAESKSDKDIRRILLYCCGAGGLGAFIVFLRPFLSRGPGISLSFVAYQATNSLFWALGMMGLGFLLGFLFGIPKVLQSTALTGPGKAQSAARENVQNISSRLKVNTNLEEISDWLTKLLVGATLTQLVRLPHALKTFATFVAGNDSSNEQSFAASVIIYFSVTGFLSGYLVTRTYFTVVFGRADNTN